VHAAASGSALCGLKSGELAVGGALRSAGQRAASYEPDEGFAGSGGFFVVVAPFEEGGEPLVGVAAYEAFGDAGLVERDDLPDIATQRVLGRPDLLAEICSKPVFFAAERHNHPIVRHYDSIVIEHWPKIDGVYRSLA
jgi:hypothetical protein